ncbi:hypothetical protein FRACYDRAFT_256979 [Fragilariopsis cylindrus CCMP1102]|uniref:Uncharacterized protein n=1 Tax=Fragilariopsis cylindrus CCMP1102 TaxID=635003 RepID=A0A1E7EJF7_9STRA|nr:hypothetical protein FRACYDRAFT_256979 [Fragilariopsis cylindrus CCMP1102]|eukprot:OEU05992.1 hypothetical protein FRACYDRAFT_256979 [Fragilariopsis cylindrus CCMP1102]
MSGTVVFYDGNEPRYGGYATGGDYAITGSVGKTDFLETAIDKSVIVADVRLLLTTLLLVKSTNEANPSEYGTPCCEERMQPTLKGSDQLTSHIFAKKASSLRGAETNVSPNPLLSKSPFLPAFEFNPWLAPCHTTVANSCGILGGWKYDKSSRD